jgi:hypothetical protein
MVQCHKHIQVTKAFISHTSTNRVSIVYTFRSVTTQSLPRKLCGLIAVKSYRHQRMVRRQLAKM